MILRQGVGADKFAGDEFREILLLERIRGKLQDRRGPDTRMGTVTYREGGQSRHLLTDEHQGEKV